VWQVYAHSLEETRGEMCNTGEDEVGEAVQLYDKVNG
jgi:hypothetical protein